MAALINIDNLVKGNIVMKKFYLLGLFLFCVISFVGCGLKSEESKIPELYDFKTAYVGDNSKIIGVVSYQEYPGKWQYSSIEVQSQKEPYALNIRLKNGNPIAEKDFFKNAVNTFALIDNLFEIVYLPEIGEEPMAIFTRKSVDQDLAAKGQKSIKELGASKENFRKYQKA